MLYMLFEQTVVIKCTLHHFTVYCSTWTVNMMNEYIVLRPPFYEQDPK